VVFIGTTTMNEDDDVVFIGTTTMNEDDDVIFISTTTMNEDDDVIFIGTTNEDPDEATPTGTPNEDDADLNPEDPEDDSFVEAVNVTDETCPICLEKFADGATVLMFFCGGGHLICEHCSDKYDADGCMICRRPINVAQRLVAKIY